MLSAEENELLCRVGPGTPMGELLRQYWQPFLRSSDLPERDGRPMRVRLLSEDLVAFRDSEGRIGLVASNCPHRGASLFFGRNEEEGLRCVYHGWKFDVSGRCVDMPNEPADSNFKDKVHAIAYPTQERNGIIWTYMGALDSPPPLPALEWNLVPEDQCYVSLRIAQCNWVQTMEGEIDSSHSGFLHSSLNADADIERGRAMQGSEGMLYKMLDKHPRFETLDVDAGVTIAARRNAGDDGYYWRITQFALPFYTIIPPYGPDPTFGGHAWVPVDDYNTLCMCFGYHPTKPLGERRLNSLMRGRNGVEGLHPSVDVFLPPDSRPYGQFWPRINKDNDYEFDWNAQLTQRFSGLPGTWPQDSACQETMGPIYDRTQERLGGSDTGIIAVRRRLINAAKALRDQGVTPETVMSPDLYRIRSAAVVLPRTVSWVEGAGEQRTATPGVNYPAA
jgi:phenylpropionate dioxygenase-like ring-hydroxylating dioxygenase large terminal subunit